MAPPARDVPVTVLRGAVLRRRRALGRRRGHARSTGRARWCRNSERHGAQSGRRPGTGRDLGGHRRAAAEVVLWDVDPATGRWSQRESLRGPRRRCLRGRDRPGRRAAGDGVRRQRVDRLGRPARRRLRDVASRASPDRWAGQRPGRRRAGPAGGRADAAARPGPARQVPVRRRGNARRGGDLPRPPHRRGGRPGPGGGHASRTRASAPPRRSAPTAGWSPSPPVWPPPCSTRARARSSERIVLPPNGDEGWTASPIPAGIVCCAVWTRGRFATAARARGATCPGLLVPTAPRAARRRDRGRGHRDLAGGGSRAPRPCSRR